MNMSTKVLAVLLAILVVCSPALTQARHKHLHVTQHDKVFIVKSPPQYEARTFADFKVGEPLYRVKENGDEVLVPATQVASMYRITE
ncbi:hypothetical protein D8674_001051 [Pyrus ussuriensis x Pyrus communis]|uniref:Uncharacterized protein n=1 Tax=Pyrus ussuriensis x Pyrus communis TaxID=2448454 RepID=A0A5N5F7V8_9ROSA|nr:hypothetical protein D8674_001051 [Pyrus ussuriensis x Pyrus communis]